MTKLTDEEISAIYSDWAVEVDLPVARAIEAEARKMMREECAIACDKFAADGYEMGEAADKLRAME